MRSLCPTVLCLGSLFACHGADTTPGIRPTTPIPRSSGATGSARTLYVFSATQRAPFAGAGDFNADGFDDLVVGEPQFDSGRGRAEVYSGLDGTLIVELDLAPAGSTSQFGASLASAGDVDGDLFDDLLIGAPGATPAGNKLAYLVPGATGAAIRTIDGGITTGEFGAEVASIGDVDGDLAADFAVGEPFSRGTETGVVRVFSSLTGLEIYRQPVDRTGTGPLAITAIRDISYDGIDDLLVAAGRGNTVVLSGGDGRVMRSSPAGAVSTAVVGDCNYDLVDDYAFGFSSAGLVQVRSALNGRVLTTLRGDDPGSDLFGDTIAGVGDFDGDGACDVLVGAIGYATIQSGVTARELWRYRGDRLKLHRVATIGDVNADGVLDYAIEVSGTITVYSGAELSLAVDLHQISAATGGEQKLFLRAGVERAGFYYQVLGSSSGTIPGFVTPSGVQVPLNPDAYTQLSLTSANTGQFVMTLGRLSADGSADAAIQLPPLPPDFVGLVLNHAFTVRSVGTLAASTPVSLVVTR